MTAMKLHSLAFLLIAAGSLPSLCQQPSSPGAPQEEPGPPPSQVPVALQIAVSTQAVSIDGNIAVYVDERTWPAALKDGDLGSFLKLNPAKPDRHAVLIMTPKADQIVCVFFDADAPFAVAAARNTAGGKIDPESIAASYKLLPPDLIKKPLSFELTPGEINTDDGTALSAYRIKLRSTG
jgi:hypothetical protein